MKTTFFKRLLVSGLLVGLPLLGFSQAVCTRYYTPLGWGWQLVTTSCSNAESNTAWIE